MGHIMAVVAMLLVHIDRNQAGSIIPIISLRSETESSHVIIINPMPAKYLKQTYQSFNLENAIYHV